MSLFTGDDDYVPLPTAILISVVILAVGTSPIWGFVLWRLMQ